MSSPKQTLLTHTLITWWTQSTVKSQEVNAKIKIKSLNKELSSCLCASGRSICVCESLCHGCVSGSETRKHSLIVPTHSFCGSCVKCTALWSTCVVVVLQMKPPVCLLDLRRCSLTLAECQSSCHPHSLDSTNCFFYICKNTNCLSSTYHLEVLKYNSIVIYWGQSI